MVFENKMPKIVFILKRGSNRRMEKNHIIMSFMFSYRYVYDSWVRLDVIGLNVQHTRQE
jgi:hypothetical protein